MPRTEAGKRLLQGQFAYAMSPEMYLPGDFTTAYDDVIDKALAEAVTAALDALAAQVEGLRVRSESLAENDYLIGFRASRNETVEFVLALIAEARR